MLSQTSFDGLVMKQTFSKNCVAQLHCHELKSGELHKLLNPFRLSYVYIYIYVWNPETVATTVLIYTYRDFAIEIWGFYRRLTDTLRYSVRNSACSLVRDKWLFTGTSKQSVSSYPSDKWKFTTIFYFSLSFSYNAVIERQNAKDFTLENRQRSRCYLMSQK